MVHDMVCGITERNTYSCELPAIVEKQNLICQDRLIVLCTIGSPLPSWKPQQAVALLYFIRQW